MKLRSPKVPLLALAACLLAGVACSGGNGPAGPPAGYQGEFDLERFLTYLPATSPSPYLYANADFTGAGRYLDAGDSVVLHGSAGDIDLVRDAVVNEILYQKAIGTSLPLSLFVPGTSYSAKSAGSSQDLGVPAFDLEPAIRTPDGLTLLKPDITSGQLTVTATTALNLSWVPGNGDYLSVILIVVSGGSGSEVAFRLADTGTASIPAIQVAQLPPGTGTFTIERVINTPLVLPEGGSAQGTGADALACKLTRQ